jgi:hypothetical protein
MVLAENGSDAEGIGKLLNRDGKSVSLLIINLPHL